MKYFPKKLIVWKLEIHAGITTKKCNHELVKYSFRTITEQFLSWLTFDFKTSLLYHSQRSLLRKGWLFNNL